MPADFTLLRHMMRRLWIKGSEFRISMNKELKASYSSNGMKGIITRLRNHSNCITKS
jgi:hypothetical protein